MMPVTKQGTLTTNLKIIKQRGKKTRKTLAFIVDLDLYSTHVLVCLGHNDEECGEILDGYEGIGHRDMDEWKLGKSVGKVVIFKNNAMLLRMTNFPVSCENYNTLSHEIFHVVELLMIRIGASLNEGSSECYAYAIGYLTEKIFEKINDTV